jgi:hypothetical protein
MLVPIILEKPFSCMQKAPSKYHLPLATFSCRRALPSALERHHHCSPVSFCSASLWHPPLLNLYMNTLCTFPPSFPLSPFPALRLPNSSSLRPPPNHPHQSLHQHPHHLPFISIMIRINLRNTQSHHPLIPHQYPQRIHHVFEVHVCELWDIC